MQKEYRTKDQLTATVLYATDHILIGTVWQGATCFFLYKKPSSCERTMAKFYQGDLIINAKVIFDAQKNIKSP